jgi:hypothetical protein
VEYLMQSNPLIRKKDLRAKNKFPFSQFKQSLKSPKRFQQFLGSLESWLSSEKDSYQIKRFLKVCYSLYHESAKEARPSLIEVLQSWFILCLQNPSVFSDFTSYIVKEGSQGHSAEQGDQASPGETTQPRRRVSRENQRAHESLEQTHKRLLRKYGEDQFMITAQRVYEDAKGIQYQAMAKNVPVKYISIGQASEEFGIANHTLANWVADGWLHNVTKVEHPKQPEIGVVLVEPREVAKLKEKLGVGEEAAEPRLVSLPDAAKKYDLPYGTVRTWYRSGQLPEKGREVFGTHGGGKILVAESDVIRLKHRRTPKRRRGYAPQVASTGEGDTRARPEARRARQQDLAQSYEVVTTLRQAAEKTGVPVEELMTVRDITAEWGVGRTRIHDWSRRGHHGQPHLTPLPVRLKGAGGGQLLFLREEVERKMANPPKPGRPWQ